MNKWASKSKEAFSRGHPNRKGADKESYRQIDTPSDSQINTFFGLTQVHQKNISDGLSAHY